MLRYNEWGRAVLKTQTEHLRTSSGHEWFFTAFYGQHEAVDCADLQSEIAGSLVSVWASRQQWLVNYFWNVSFCRSGGIPVLKPGRRPGHRPLSANLFLPWTCWRFKAMDWCVLASNIFFNQIICVVVGAGASRIPAVVAESFTNASDGGKLLALKEKVESFNSKFASHFGDTASTTSAAGATPAGSPARTHCRPAFADGDRPLDFTKTILAAVAKPITEFDADMEFLGVMVWMVSQNMAA